MRTFRFVIFFFPLSPPFRNMIGCGLGAIICDNDGLPEGCNALLAQAAKAATLRSMSVRNIDETAPYDAHNSTLGCVGQAKNSLIQL